MSDYLLHRLDQHGRSAAAEVLSFDTEQAAIRHALGPEFPYGCELWDAHRLVGRFCRPFEASLGAPAVKAGSFPEAIVQAAA